MMPSDESLLNQFKQGDASAFRALVERYAAPLYNLAVRLLRDPMEAENITQETFLRVVGALDRVQLNAPFKPYLFRIAVNLCHDQARKRKPLLFADMERAQDDELANAEDAIVDDAPPLWERIEEEELRARLRDAVDDLPPSYQAAIILRYVEDFSYDDIAQTLDLPVNTVRTRLRRAKQQLRARLDKDTRPPKPVTQIH
jgi:RNA polymerase sigma-70 factor (ECF subfamily)